MRLGVFIRAVRLPFLTGSVMPVAVAAAYAYWEKGVFDLGLLALTVFGVASLHLGGNLINDFYDSLGSDPINVYATPFSGGSRVIQNQELSAETVLFMAYLFFGLGALCGLALIYLGRPYVVVLGLLGLGMAYLYSASPVQLMSLGLGELTIFLAFGPVLSFGAYYVMTGLLKPVGLAVSLPLAFLITAILWINEFPDLEADQTAAKRHLVVRLGLNRARWLYAVLMIAPFLSLFVLLEGFNLPGLIFAALAALPLAVNAVRQAWVTDPTDPEFVAVQALTIKTHFLTGVAMTVALLYAAWRQ
jgi:1,4-dihydroxy-2-naphthoate polyprenyltransferase